MDTNENLLSSGRVSRGKARLAGVLDVEPVLLLDHDGEVNPVDRVRRRELVVAGMLAHVERLLAPRLEPVRSGMVHADAPDLAGRVRTARVAASRPGGGFVARGIGALGAHAGSVAGKTFHQVEDGTPLRFDT